MLIDGNYAYIPSSSRRKPSTGPLPGETASAGQARSSEAGMRAGSADAASLSQRHTAARARLELLSADTVSPEHTRALKVFTQVEAFRDAPASDVELAGIDILV